MADGVREEPKRDDEAGCCDRSREDCCHGSRNGRPKERDGSPPLEPAEELLNEKRFCTERGSQAPSRLRLLAVAGDVAAESERNVENGRFDRDDTDACG